MPASGISFEVCATNDGSTDDTADQVAHKYPEVRLFHNIQNKGISDSMNTIISHMRGRYLQRLDADTIISAKAIQQQYDYMELHPEVGIVGPRMFTHEGVFQPSYMTTRRRPITWFFDYALWIKKLLLSRSHIMGEKMSTPTSVAVVIGASILTRMLAIKQVQGFDPTFRVFMDDADWCYRVANNGWDITYLPSAEIIHRGGSAWGGQYIHTKPKALQNLHDFYAKHNHGKVGQIELDIAIITGSALSIFMALIATPFFMWIPRYRIILFRAFRSFGNVFIWYLKRGVT